MLRLLISMAGGAGGIVFLVLLVVAGHMRIFHDDTVSVSKEQPRPGRPGLFFIVEFKYVPGA
ncbi:MAG: hypothetical protein A2505_03260 [Deltaproteobacteria bacterium RIFOXYD12_FULL_55_16]|nr:MAG: hypothetical protein A2505_03260 [Deltaproteobacteria bacterium RIFOXYD12_FULL_55_16]